MVKQQLWIINSALIAFAVISIAIVQLIKQELPTTTPKRRFTALAETRPPRIIVTPEKIYQNDLFDTFSPPAEPAPVSKSLVTPIPQLNVKNATIPAKNQRVDFIPPLDVTVKGIIMSPEPKNSIVMVADATGKEQMYHIGDKINDGQVLKITKNQMLVIRANGQQETFYLRKPEKLNPGLASWDTAVKKIDDSLYHLDPIEITKEITSVGEVIEALDICSAYKDGKPIGIVIGSLKNNTLGGKLGLVGGDIITKINDLPVTSSKERIAVYDAIAGLNLGDYIHLSLTREGKNIDLSYLLKKIEKPSPFGGQGDDKDASKTQAPGDLFQLGKDAQRQQTRRRFDQIHRTAEQHETAVAEMRKKILDDMRNRAPNRRVL